MARRKYPEQFANALFHALERDAPALLHDQLAERIRSIIQGGLLRPGDYLPPLRLLATKLEISVGTVARAYDVIVRSGLASPHGTRGVRVGEAGSPTPGRPWVPAIMRPVVPRDPLIAAVPRAQGAHAIRFDVTEVAGESIPAGFLARAVGGALDERGALGYGPLDGIPPARAALTEYLRRRGVPLDDAAMILTSGTTQSLAILAHALVHPGGVVLVEQPTWHVALSVFAAARVRVVAVPVDDDGIQLDPLRHAVLKHGPAFLYLQPSVQNPTGISLSGERRAGLLDLARRLHLLVVEDDVAAELAFETIQPPLRGPGSEDVVIYLKSFAKLLAPAVRVGVIVAPARYEAPLRMAKHGLDPFVSTLGQNIVAQCLATKGFDRHLRALSAELNMRWGGLRQALEEVMPAGTRWTTPRGGLSTWLEFPPGTHLESLVAELAARGVALTPGDLFCVDVIGVGSARLAFSATPPALIQRGVEIIAEVLREHLRAGQRLSPPTGATAP